MDAQLTERELAAASSAVLDRVRRGERFVIERDGTPLATLVPPIPSAGFGISARALVARIGRLRVPEDGFVEEIEQARSALQPLRPPRSPLALMS